jgi:peptidyl-tRNA hydrolase, PTH1 family
MRVIMGLGNPGSKYDDTRHNVGWWAVDRLAHEWSAGPFREVGPALHCSAMVAGEEVVLVKPLTYMNRSAAALHPFLGLEGFDPVRDLLVIVDDATRDAGRLRLRADGSSGGHNGLRSIEGLVGREFPRLRIGVGRPPSGGDLVGWVLSPMSDEDEDQVLALLSELPDLVVHWIEDGVQETMNRFNR